MLTICRICAADSRCGWTECDGDDATSFAATLLPEDLLESIILIPQRCGQPGKFMAITSRRCRALRVSPVSGRVPRRLVRTQWRSLLEAGMARRSPLSCWAMRGEDLNVVVRVGDGVAQPQQRFASLDGVEGERWELVHAGHEAGIVGAQLEQDLGERAALAQAEEIRRLAAELRGARARDVLAACLAHGVDRTVQTEGCPRQADGRAELHHGLVVIAGGVDAFADAPLRDECACLALHEGAAFGGFDLGAAGQAEQDALDVAVDDGDAFAEGDAGDGGAGVFADAGEGAELCGGGGEHAVAFADEELGGLVEHAGSAVVAEAGPGGEDFGFGGEREGRAWWGNGAGSLS